MKKIILILLILVIVGCGKKEIKDVFDNLSKEEVVAKLDNVITYVKMFPNQENENELINYTESICKHLDKFSDEELKNIYNKLNLNYSFEYNSLNYDRSNYNSCLDKIKR